MTLPEKISEWPDDLRAEYKRRVARQIRYCGTEQVNAERAIEKIMRLEREEQ